MPLAMVPAAPPTREKTSGDLLPGADFGKGALAALVEVDGQGLEVRIENFAAWKSGIGREHGRRLQSGMPMIYRRGKKSRRGEGSPSLHDWRPRSLRP
jgi:hypothetical protein